MKESLQVISLRGQDSWLSWQLARMPIAHWPHCSYLCLCLLTVFKHLFVLLLVWELYSSYHCHNISINMLASDHWHTASWVHLTSSLTHLSKAAAAELKNFLERHKTHCAFSAFGPRWPPGAKFVTLNWSWWKIEIYGAESRQWQLRCMGVDVEQGYQWANKDNAFPFLRLVWKNMKPVFYVVFRFLIFCCRFQVGVNKCSTS